MSARDDEHELFLFDDDSFDFGDTAALPSIYSSYDDEHQEQQQQHEPPLAFAPSPASNVSSPVPSSPVPTSALSSFAFATMSPGRASGGGGGSASDGDGASERALLLERRRKQRDLKRKSRARKKDDVESMKEQVRMLEAKYEQLYIAKMGTSSSSTTNPPAAAALPPHYSSDANAQNPTLLDQYTRAKEEMTVLRSQIATMKEQIVAFDLFSSALESYVGDFASQPSEDPLLREQPDPFEPLSEATCFAIIQQCYQQIFSPQWRGQRISTGAQIFGWRDERFVDGTTLQFSLTKSFTNLSAEHMMQKTWDIVTTVEHMHTIQRSTIGVKVLQVINDDVLVAQRCVHHPQLDKVTCVNMLMFRLRIERGYVVAYLAIDHLQQASQSASNAPDDSNQATFFDIDDYMKDHTDVRRGAGGAASGGASGNKKPKVSWVDMMQWFIFEEAPSTPEPASGVEYEDDLVELAASLLDEVLLPSPPPASSHSHSSHSSSSSVVNVTFGGRMDNKDLNYISYFLIEVVSMIMRWDQAVAASRLMFYATEDPAASANNETATSSSSAAPSLSWDSSEEYKFA